MSALLFLTDKDFHISQGSKGNIMCHRVSGYSLLLFYSNQCEHCKNLVPIFRRLPGTIGGCQFGMVNVGTYKNCVYMSQNTIAPIKFVPYIVLYVKGKPYMRYNGPYDINEIRRFVLEITQKLSKNEIFTSANVKETDGGKSIPSYTIGHPLYGNPPVCYLDFNKAYKKKM